MIAYFAILAVRPAALSRAVAPRVPRRAGRVELPDRGAAPGLPGELGREHPRHRDGDAGAGDRALGHRRHRAALGRLGFFSVLESAFNIVYGLPNRPFIRQKTLVLLLTAASLVVLFLALVISSLGVELANRAGVVEGALSYVYALVVSTLLLVGFTWSMYRCSRTCRSPGARRCRERSWPRSCCRRASRSSPRSSASRTS